MRVSTATTLALAAYVTLVTSMPIEFNPTTDLVLKEPLSPSHPAYGGPSSTAMVKPTVHEDVAISRAEVIAEVQAEEESGSAVGNETISAYRSRKLEATSADLQRLEEYFGTSMEKNVDVIQQKYAKGEFKPAPWPSSYWPVYEDSINYQWEAGQASPAEKYATAFGLNVKDFMNKISANNGIDRHAGYVRTCKTNDDCASLNDGSTCARRTGSNKGYCIPTWWGICHAWAPASMLEPEPQCSVVKNGVTFKVFDIKALLTEIYDGANVPVVFTGARYDGGNDGKDEYGRDVDAMKRDLGPGFFHIAVTNILGRFKKSFIVDVAAGAEVWNQPIRSYSVEEFTLMTPAAAAKKFFNVAKYPFNKDAKQIAYVHLHFGYINEFGQDGPLVNTGIVDQATFYQEYYYILELDSKKNIIGGEWVYGSQDVHPDFLWFVTNTPSDGTVTSVGMSYKNVKDLLQQSVNCPTPSPTPAPSPPVSGGDCGNHETGPLACPEGEYCQPWNPFYYQCWKMDATCGKQETGIDYYGDDLTMISVLLPEWCCDECHQTPGCKAYTFVNYNEDGYPRCYLKTGMGERRETVGVVSAVVN
ncbi:hypothetical protein Poli38472_007098 [Pythium oligandrum]|uniref:Apple domain-containing protein n=1 Tax=Pythium oligandrum TaxID=41045 RepID=A0A8K1C9L5_PYTOL|nr:hypothetical protein Poli38472_007098 [Pythium oligandrum]|eukprot:TMW58953.1 hypothetical protein Poli38472_007098 [Pythium oligandrum]